MSEHAGALLLGARLISKEALHRAMAGQQEHGGTLGASLIRLGAVDEEHLVEFFRHRLMVQRLGFEQLAAVPERALRCIPADMAAEFRVLPVDLDAEKNLTLAMADPSDTHAVDEVAFFTGCYVVRAVVTESVMDWAIDHYYGIAGGGIATPSASQSWPLLLDGTSKRAPAESGRLPQQPAAAIAGRSGPARSPVGQSEEAGAQGKSAALARAPLPARQPPSTPPWAEERPAKREERPARKEERPARKEERIAKKEERPRTAQRPAAERQRAEERPAPQPRAVSSVEAIAVRREPEQQPIGPDEVFACSGWDAVGWPGAASAEPRPVPEPPRLTLEPLPIADQPIPLTRVKRRVERDDGSPPAAGGQTSARTEAQSSTAPAPPARLPAAGPRVAATQQSVAQAAQQPAVQAAQQPAVQAAQQPASRAAQERAAPATQEPPARGGRSLETAPYPSLPRKARSPLAAPPAGVAVPAPAPAAGAAPALSSFADTLRRLRTAVHRDAVAEAVLDYMTRICGRSAFLALRRSTLQAAGSRGFGGAQGEILSHAISIEASSVFRDVASTRLPYRGPLPAAATEAAFARAAGGVQGDVVLVPIVVRDRSVAVVFGDGVQAAVEEGSLVAIAHEAGRAFGRIITAAKPQ